MRQRARLRWEMTATNFFNTPNYTTPDDPSVDFSNITSTGAVGVITATGGGSNLDSNGARSFRMGLRMEW